MPAVITIPPHYWNTQISVDLLLVTQNGDPYPAATLDNASFLAGHYRFDVDPALGYSLTLPCNDEIPIPPNETESSAWLICVQHPRTPVCYQVAIHSGSPPTTWNELLGAAEQVDASHIFTPRLLPLGAVQGQFAVKGAGDAWEPIDPPAGTGDMIGPAGAVDGHLVVFSGPSGKLTQDGGPVPTGGVADHGALSGLADDDHLQYHTDARGDARYELLDATILRQADVQDTPADGDTLRPPSANWAYDHAALAQAHGISAFGAGLVASVDAGAARSVLDAEQADATILRQADVQDTPADGDTLRPPSANWAYDHAALAQAHGISAFGAGLVAAVDAGAARSVLDAEQADATILRQADVQDTPADGDVSRPPSANWAYDHAALTQAHGISAFGAGLVSAADAAGARSLLGAQEEITEIVGLAGF